MGQVQYQCFSDNEQILSLASKPLCIDARIPMLWKACLAEFNLWVSYGAHFRKKNKQPASRHVIIKPKETYIHLLLFLLRKRYLFKGLLGRERRKLAALMASPAALSSRLSKMTPFMTGKASNCLIFSCFHSKPKREWSCWYSWLMAFVKKGMLMQQRLKNVSQQWIRGTETFPCAWRNTGPL